MADKRSIEDLSIAELERVLTIKKRQEREKRLRRMKQSGRVIETGTQPPQPMPWEKIDPVDSSDASGLPAQTIAMDASALQSRKTVPEFEDAVDVHEFKKNSRANRIWRMFVDRSLLLVEAGAVIGLVMLGLALFNGLEILQEETAAAAAAADEIRRAGIPTIEPTPELQLANVVLPTGHTPPQNGISSFNFDEIPEALRGRVASQVFLSPDMARPPVTDDTPVSILIPGINVDRTIVQGVDWNALQQGVGMLPNGATPRSDRDNVVLAAHNDIYGEIFKDLDQLQPGDPLQIQTPSGVYTYLVREYIIVDPDDVYVMNSQGSPMITLISCYPYRVNTHRIVVYADRVSNG